MLSLIFTPSAGHWYSGKFFTKGMGMRAGGIAIAVTGFVTALNDDCFISCGDDDDRPSDPDGDNALGGAIILGGAVLFVAGVSHDIATADNAARDYNERHRFRVAPIVSRDQVGMAVTGTF